MLSNPSLALVGLLMSGSAAHAQLTLSVVDNVGNQLPGLAAFTDNDAVNTSIDGTSASIVFSLTSGDLDAMHQLPSGNWLVSSLFNGSFGGVTFDDGDLVEIDPVTDTFVATRFSNTEFDTAGEDITGVSVLADGSYLLSTLADATLAGVAFTDGDIVRYDPMTGTASIFVSEADLFDDGDGDVYGIHAFEDGSLLLTANADEVISGTLFRDGDAFLYNPASDTATLYFSEDTFLGENTYDIDALYVVPAPGAASLVALAGLGVLRRRRA